MTTAPEVYLPTRLRSLARIVNAERRVTTATQAALADLAGQVRDQLAADGWTASVLDNRAPEWREALAQRIMPVIADVYAQGFAAEAREGVTAAVMPSGEQVPGDFGMADHMATQYLQTVHNRMVGVADDVFARIATALEQGRQAQFTLEDGTTVVGESIPQLAARVDALLADNTTWSGDATRVARTEVIGANNAGAEGAAYANAELFGVSSNQVVKEWLNTHDHRTRPTHQAAGGQVVLGMDTPFSVGAGTLQRPGDPAGPAGEVINCRCTALYHYPGDPGYDDLLVRAGGVPSSPETVQAVARESQFTPEQLKTALDPSTRRTTAAITKELQATPAGKDLTAAIKGFTETRGGVANLRKNITATLDGTASKPVAAKTSAFLDAMNTYPTADVPQLFRGMAVRVEADTNEWWDAFEGQFQVGQKIDLNASSFTSSEKKAQEFQSSIGGTRRATSNYTAVRFVLEDGSHALPVEQLSKFKAEREWITGGQFEVVGYSRATREQPYYRVVIRQTKTLEAP